MAALTDEPKAKPTIRTNPRVSRAASDGSIIPITEQLISVCCPFVFLGDLPSVFPSTAGTVLGCLCAQEGFVAILAGSLQLLGSLGRAACSCGTEKEAEHYSGRLSTAMSGFRRKFGDFGIRLHNGQGRTYQTKMGEALWKVSQ
ncbi:MAG: hypothetical protein UZ03_NOB001002749 [Nitrospira sp. OLB3]|nr:MAG: hypothetical protein UZ03_NOB001002749 [Nitrospira sp. OLB3]